MIKQLFFLSLSAAVLSACTSSTERPVSGEEEAIFSGYQELPDPAGVNEKAWEELEKPLYAAFGSTDQRYAKSEVPGIGLHIDKNSGNSQYLEAQARSLSWQGKAWKGEKVNLQVVLWATEDIRNLKITATALNSDEGGTIPSSALKAGFVRYVMTDEFAGGCGARKPADFDSSLVADVIDVRPALDIPARSVRPVWIQIEVPRDAKPGEYLGKVSVENSSEAEVTPLTIHLEVQDRVLPPPSEWIPISEFLMRAIFFRLSQKGTMNRISIRPGRLIPIIGAPGLPAGSVPGCRGQRAGRRPQWRGSRYLLSGSLFHYHPGRVRSAHRAFRPGTGC